jgi:sulfofructose kinase
MPTSPTTPARLPLVSCTGIITSDTIFGVPELPTGDGKLSASWIRETGGGVAANAAVAVARLGGRARFIGAVGTDARGLAARNALIAEGIHVDQMHQIEQRSTPTSAVLVDRQGARIVINHVADDFFALADPRWAHNVTGADAVLVDLRWIAGAEASVTAAQEAGLPSIVDVDRPVPTDSGILQMASHLLFSRDALVSMTGIPRPGDALMHLATVVPGWIGVTVGDEGVLWLDRGALHHLRAHDIAVVDTLAAGDTFHGAFALALAEGRGENEALRFANAAAALKCARTGGRNGIPHRGEVEQFINELSRSTS